jgi:hypothetical protein
MTDTTPTTSPVAMPPAEGTGLEVAHADAVFTGRAMSSARFLAGLLLNGQLATVGRPDRLPQDLFPDVDPAVVQAVWDRALAVGLHAGRVSSSPRFYRDELDRIAGQLAGAGFVAMGRLVAGARRVVAPEVHPADAEEGRVRP